MPKGSFLESSSRFFVPHLSICSRTNAGNQKTAGIHIIFIVFSILLSYSNIVKLFKHQSKIK